MGAHHIIRKQHLHVEVNGTQADGLALQRSLSGLCAHELAPAIERALERCSPPEGHLYVERLDIDAGSLSLDRLEHDLPGVVERAVEKALREQASQSPSGNVRHVSARQTLDEAFVTFLHTGSLPWSFHLPEGSNLEQTLLGAWQQADAPGANTPAARDALLRALASATARERLVRQFSTGFLEVLLSLLAPEYKRAVNDALQAARPSGASPREAVSVERQPWEPVFANLAAGKPPADLAGRTPRDSQGSPGTKPGQGTTGEHPEIHEGLYVDQAGLVLLYPFLPRFFEALGIARGERLLKPERALCLLHYLATGQSVAPEYELILPKVLCNVPAEAPAESDVGLTDAERDEATALLEAVIRHWGALRSTSPDALRGTFLIRPGKLSLREDGDWLLQVEPSGCDILLDQLPWGIAMIKLPWMEKMLWVEWRQDIPAYAHGPRRAC